MKRLPIIAESIKFAHTVFALPFALIAFLLASGDSPDLPALAAVLVCMVGARTAAMAFNRLADAEFDARNPRTRGRALPAGLLSRRFMWGMVAGGSAALIAGAATLNRTCLILSPVALAVLFAYSYSKRWTSLSHFLLGICLAMAPGGAFLAVRGDLSPMPQYAGRLDLPFEALPILLGGAVVFWTAGFDIIYACQDYGFDLSEPRLHSIPKAVGIRAALAISSVLHAICAAILALFGLYAGLGAFYFGGWGVVCGLLIYQHLIVKADDLSRADEAFFAANGLVSVLLLAAVAADAWLGR
ncbi:MAG: putative 4-hydroxybenzoate polyprenyltransferase [Planctomycetota bacterium]|nr:putative 4-hydroxybenzoate polyprenyltransferase [Planctomycetota bacterium]